jgi:hypothetical protein
MQPVEGDTMTDSKSVNGNDYPRSVYLLVSGKCDWGAKPSSGVYELGRKWGSLTATMGLADDSMSLARVELNVYADDSLIAHYVARVNADKHVQLNVSGVGRLKLEEIYMGGVDHYCNVASAVWGDAKLSK